MAVDWEQRVDFDKLRKDRVEKANKTMKKYGIGSAIVTQYEFKRYLTSLWVHPYSKHKAAGFALFIKDNGHPYLGASDRDLLFLEEQAPWLKGKFMTNEKMVIPSPITFAPDKLKEQNWAKSASQIKALLKQHRVADEPISVDYNSIYLFEALKKEGLKVVDGNNWQLEARMIKTEEEIELLRMANTCQDAAYAELCRVFRAGMRENDARAIMLKAATEAGAEYEEGWVTGSGARQAPRRYNWSDRTVRSGDMFALEMCHVTYCGYKNCMSRTFMVGAKPTELQKEFYDQLVYIHDRIYSQFKPGASTHAIAKTAASTYYGTMEDIKKQRKELGIVEINNHMGGMGISHAELPYITMEEPNRKLEPGMVIAYSIQGWAKKPGSRLNAQFDIAGADIENTVVITDTGNEMLTVFPWRDLLIIGYPGALYGDKMTDQLNVTVK